MIKRIRKWLRGPRGEIGPTGPKGDKGEAGPAGPVGKSGLSDPPTTDRHDIGSFDMRWRDLWISGVGTGKDFVALSDRSLKDNITDMDPVKCLDQVLGLSPKNFIWKDNGQKDSGLIAQDVQEILPEHVHGESVLAVSYGKIVTQLIGAIHELNGRVQELERRDVD